MPFEVQKTVLSLFKWLRAFFFVLVLSLIPAIITNVAWRFITKSYSSALAEGGWVTVVFGGNFPGILIFWMVIVSLIFHRVLYVTGYSL